MKHLLLPLGMACCLASCTTPSSRTAAHLAGLTISQIAAYEQEMDDKINAEEAYYATQGDNLVELQSFKSMEANGEVEDGALVRRRGIYQRINIQANRDGIALVDKTLAQGTPITRANLMLYVSQGITDDTQNIEKAINGRRQIRKELLGSLVDLDAGKANLEEARKALTELREKKSTFAQLRELVKFGRLVKEKLDADKEKEKEKKSS